MGIRALFGKFSSHEVGKAIIPKHVAVTVRGTQDYAKKNNITLNDANKVKFLHIKNVVKTASKAGIKMLTIHLHDEIKEDELDFLAHFCYELREWDYLQEEKIKVNLIGKWFLLSQRVVDPLKDLINATKENNNFFLNLCINYNGQEEIIEACKLIAQKAVLGKIDPQIISYDTIKEHIYTSGIQAPEVIINTNGTNTEGFFLWDSAKSRIFSIPVTWPDFGRNEFLKAIEWWQKK